MLGYNIVTLNTYGMDAKCVQAHIYVTITIAWLYSAKHSVYGRHINYAGALAYSKCLVINGGEI
jgi:hypothetical protein